MLKFQNYGVVTQYSRGKVVTFDRDHGSKLLTKVVLQGHRKFLPWYCKENK